MNTTSLNSHLASRNSQLIVKPSRRISRELSPAQHQPMNPFTRFLRFNLVGIIGIAVQLTTLAILNRALPTHILLTSTLAVELTLLHNFIWHLHYTWPSTPSPSTALLRFHLSNGLISLLGNLTLMHLFTHLTRLPILLDNILAIAICGLANFLLAHHWVFHLPRDTSPHLAARS